VRRDSPKQTLLLAALGIIPIVWLGLLIAPAIAGGLPEILTNLTAVMNNPFHITICGDSLKTVLFFVAAYGFGIGIYLSTKRNYRRREEHGSAKWGDAATVNRRYRDTAFAKNKILTQNVRLGFDAHKHRRNLNVLICGGSGAGKTRFYAKPNVMQANSSMVILDPKGEILRDTGHLLERKGVKVKVLDLINMEKSYCYNPFVYLHSDTDVQKLVTNLFKATTPKGSQSQDPFWDNSASMLLSALIFYLRYEAPGEEQNFAMVMEMLRAADVKEDDDEYRSPLDDLFDILESEEPEHIAVKYYKLYRKGSGKTLKSIQITLAARLEKFNLDEMERLTATDELDIVEMGTVKTALFVIIPDSDTSFNFLVSILYTQLFQTLFYQADHVHKGALPTHVHFIMDEFANVALPDDFEKDLSTMRSRGVSVSIILQNLAQLKALFEKAWESIVGNCDEFLYLGGNEQSTHKYVSELLGKATIDTNTYGKSLGRNGSYSTNYQNSGRELMTPDEVRMLDNRYALLFIRGERPVQDDKFDILRHPDVSGTTDGKAAPYDHGAETRSLATAQFIRLPIEPAPETDPADEQESTYVLYSETDLENLFNEKENANYEKSQKQTEQAAPPRRKPKPAGGQDEQTVYPQRRREARS
jgi:type IV secretion system protein VirD4